MNGLRFARPALAGALFVAATMAVAAPAQAPEIVALTKMELGQWTLRNSDGSSRSLCVSDPKALLQIHHGSAQCSRTVIDNAADRTTVTYSCPGQGTGRTVLVVETPRLIRLETQGVAHGAPFAIEFEGRRTGACTQTSSR